MTDVHFDAKDLVVWSVGNSVVWQLHCTSVVGHPNIWHFGKFAAWSAERYHSPNLQWL